MIYNNLSIFWRNITRHRMLSFIHITGLSIGIACALIVTEFVRYELSFDRHHSKADRIYKVVQDTKMGDELYHWNTTAHPLAEALRNDFSQLEFVTQASGPTSRFFLVEDADGKLSRFEEPMVLFVDSEYPKVFDLRWLQGDPTTALSKPNSCVLTLTVARKYFPRDSISHSLLGRKIFLNNKDALTVTGLIEDALPTTSLQYSMLIPYEFFKANNPYYASNWSGNYQGTTFIVPKPTVKPQEIENALLDWKKKYLRTEDDSRITYKLLPLVASHTDEKYGYAPQSYTMPDHILFAAIGVGEFMLLMACVNFVNLSTAQTASRSREVGIRKVMGGSRFNLVKQFFYENLSITICAWLFAFALTQGALGAINSVLSSINLRLQLNILSVLIVVIVGACILFASCIYPAFVLASYQPVDVFKNKLSGGKGGLSLRRLLIVFQFSIVQIFVIGTLVVASQVYYFNNKDLGFAKDKVILLTDINELDRSERLRTELMKNSAIEDVCFSSSSPMSDFNHHYGTSFRLPGQREEDAKGAEEKGVDLNFLPFYNLQLLAGRNFSGMREHFDEFIVNEKLVSELGLNPEEAVGRRMIINEGEATIVGVVRNFHNNGLQEELAPCILLNSSQWLGRANIKFAGQDDIASTTLFIEQTWKKIYPDGVMKSVFLDDVLARNYTLEHLVFQGFMTLAILTILIGCMGVFGLIHFITIRKTKEVGIRKTLGASVAAIMTLFMKEFALLVIVAFLPAALISHALMSRWLENFAYRIDLQPWMFALAGTLTLGITLFTISYQSLKAAAMNPVAALKTE